MKRATSALSIPWFQVTPDFSSRCPSKRYARALPSTPLHAWKTHADDRASSRASANKSTPSTTKNASSCPPARAQSTAGRSSSAGVRRCSGGGVRRAASRNGTATAAVTVTTPRKPAEQKQKDRLGPPGPWRCTLCYSTRRRTALRESFGSTRGWACRAGSRSGFCPCWRCPRCRCRCRSPRPRPLLGERSIIGIIPPTRTRRGRVGIAGSRASSVRTGGRTSRSGTAGTCPSALPPLRSARFGAGWRGF